MSKIIKVNKNCKINFENPTPVKQDMAVVINIEALNKTSGFLNFVFLLNDRDICCEWFDHYTDMVKTDKIYIEEIEVETNLSKEVYKRIISEEMEYGDSRGVDYIAIKIKTRKKDFYAVATNYHNGYYYHDIYYTNDSYKVTTSEDNLILDAI